MYTLLSLSLFSYFTTVTTTLENELYASSHTTLPASHCCPTSNKAATDAIVQSQESLLKPNAELLLHYAQEAGYNTHYAIIVDYTIPSYRNRLYVMNLSTGEVINKALVAHGDCKNDDYKEVHFSNTPESNCSSQGIYAIGQKYQGAWGTSYRLLGLEETNSNALSRGIVFHGFNGIPESENGQYISTSLGCPMVNPNFFTHIQNLIDAQESAMLFWIYKY